MEYKRIMEYQKNPIWMLKEGQPNIIIKGKLEVTDAALFKKLIGQLENIDSYIQTSHELVPGESKDYIELDCYGATVYTHYYETAKYNCSHHERRLANPRREVFKLITGNFCIAASPLEQLFVNIGSDRKKEDILRELQCARKMITQMEDGTFTPEAFRRKINQMWPNFGFYVCKCLDCTDIVAESSYDIDELKDIVSRCQKLNVEVSGEIKNILFCEELAQRNTKVYSLARKAHRMIYEQK